jgi:hypothetical protein
MVSGGTDRIVAGPGSATVSIGTQDHTVAADLSITKLLRQEEAKIPRFALIMHGFAFIRGGRDVNLKTHLVSFELKSV